MFNLGCILTQLVYGSFELQIKLGILYLGLIRVLIQFQNIQIYLF